MNNNGCGQLGALQTQGTCWLYSILNGFILSEDGQKILYARLKMIYETLKANERAYFNANLNAPCPMQNLTKMNQIYFWKFIDQYLCFLSGPKTAKLRAAKSVRLLRGVNLQGLRARNYGGLEGAFPQQEISQVLDHLGFKGTYYMKSTYRVRGFDGRKKPQFVVLIYNDNALDMRMTRISPIYTQDPKYSLMCASLSIQNINANSSERNRAHALAGYVCNGKGYIFDSNQTKFFKCNWWNYSDYVRVVNEEIAPIYPHFRNGQITSYEYSFVIFSRKEFTRTISPSCLRRGVVKRPAVLNNATYNSLLNMARNYENGMRSLNNLRNAGYFITNTNAQNFKERLRKKFPIAPTYLNKQSWNSLLNQANNYNHGMRLLGYMTAGGLVAAKNANLENFKARLRAKFANGAGPSRRTNNSAKNK